MLDVGWLDEWMSGWLDEWIVGCWMLLSEGLRAAFCQEEFIRGSMASAWVLRAAKE